MIVDMKLRLKITSGTLSGQEFELENGFITIGRGEMCSVRFDPASERIASKQHAFIEAKPDGFYITDNSSTNGTYVNGSRVDKAQLASGDNVQFGRNGVTATVDISEAAAVPEFQAESYRDAQIRQIEQVVENRPVTIQGSLSGLGISQAPAKPQVERSVPHIIGLVLMGIFIFLAPFLAIFVGLILLASLGPGTALLATVVAFVPAAIYILPMIGIDRYDPEPVWLLALAFTWGALAAVLVSIIVNTIFGSAVYIGTGSPGLAGILSAVISAPIIEEASKGFGLLVLLIFFRRYFDDILDGIVYASVIALGFATVENVLYYGRGLNEASDEYGGLLTSAGLTSFLILFALRGIFSPFAHATFTSMTGIGCGISRESHNILVKIAMPVVGYLAAVVLHMIWNGMSIVVLIALNLLGLTGACEMVYLGGEMIGLCGFFIAYIVVQIPLFLIFTGFTYFILRRQRRILKEMLAIDIAQGLIPEEHARIARSALRSTSWILGGIFQGKYFARGRYIRAIGKLGLSYWHIQRATAAQGQTGSFQQNPILREEVLKWRERV
jgi:RsiW-degrading membrane proteinase PrsW (M82 family)